MSEALRVISREHRNLFALLSCLRSILREAEADEALPDLDLVASVLSYLETYLNRFHHPKETQHLFPAVRRQRSDLGTVLDELEAQHEKVDPALEAIREALEDCRREGLASLHKLRDAVERYSEFEIAHMGLEEGRVLPAARESLSAADWETIDAAFLANDDPLFGDEQKRAYRRLFSEIVARAPAPHGFGGRAS